jgi:hypothetical protein
MWGYPWSLWLFVGMSIWFMANSWVTQPLPSMMALAIISVGVIAYWVWRKLAPL